MSSIRATALLAALALALLAGCQNTKKAETPAAAPTTPDRLAELRASFERQKPGSFVGVVSATLPESNLAAVVDIPIESLKVGQTITFVDGEGNPINSGRIEAIVNNGDVKAAHVKYEPGRRAPEKGDAAVWIKE